MDALVLLVVMFFVGLGTGALLHIGWVPSDEGTLAQSAVRVYQGQLPHRDFAEIYTGGLSLLHAAAFRLFGVNLLSLRICVFLFFLAWLPAVYWIARRFLSPLWAGVATLTAVSWSYPNYVAAMPSWYNLFFATFGAAALLRYLEAPARRWLLLAGVCGGASLLVKIVGLYYVAAVLLFLLFLEQSRQPAARPAESCRLYRTLCAGGLVLFVAAVVELVRPQLRDGEAYHFILPSAACAGLLLWRERSAATLSSRARFAALSRLTLPFLLGIATPIALYVIPYAASGSIGALVRGIAGSAATHAVGLAGRAHAPSVDVAYYGLVILGLIVVAMFARWAGNRVFLTIVGLGLAGLLTCFAFWTVLRDILQDVWLMAGTLTPLAVLLGIAVIPLRRDEGGTSPLAQQRIMLLISLAAVCSLVQYPFPYITYFCYTAPLTLLAVIASVSVGRDPHGKPLLGILLIFFLGLGSLAMVARHWYNPDLNPHALYTLDLPRSGGLRIDATTPGYEELIPFLQAHSPNGLVYAGNDCPEVYFLSGLKNPTRDDSLAPAADVLAALHSGQLQLAVVNDQSFFASATTSTELRAAIAHFLPQTRKIGRFTVYRR